MNLKANNGRRSEENAQVERRTKRYEECIERTENLKWQVTNWTTATTTETSENF